MIRYGVPSLTGMFMLGMIAGTLPSDDAVELSSVVFLVAKTWSGKALFPEGKDSFVVTGIVSTGEVTTGEVSTGGDSAPS